MHNLLIWCINSQPGSSTSAVLLSSYISQNDSQHTQGNFAVLRCSLCCMQYSTVRVGGENESSHKSIVDFSGEEKVWKGSVQWHVMHSRGSEKAIKELLYFTHHCQRIHEDSSYNWIKHSDMCHVFDSCGYPVVSQFWVFSVLCIHVDKMKHYQRCKYAYKICWLCERTPHKFRCTKMHCTKDLLTPAKKLE